MKNRTLFGLTKFELILWLISAIVICSSFILSHSTDYISLIGSLIGITALIFLAKGYAIGQILIIVFSVFYGIVSFYNRYYGEMITYLCMTTPMAVVALIQWIKHPFKDTKEVTVRKVPKHHKQLISILSLLVGISFYFLLKYLGNDSLTASTISIVTSFIAAYLTAVRSAYCTLAYAVNDFVLIILWVVASIKDTDNIPMIACFVMFLVNDLYGFYSWKKMERKQAQYLLDTYIN